MPEKTFQFIAGNDDFLVSRAGQNAWRALQQEAADEYSTEIIDGMAQKVDEVVQAVERFHEAVRTLPMFGGKKCVWFREISFMGETVTGKAEGSKEQVRRMITLLGKVQPTEVAVLLTAFPVDRRRKEYKDLQKLAHAQWLEDKGGQGGACASLVEEEARSLGIRFTRPALEALVETIKGNTRLGLAETRKLAAYLGPGGGTVTPELVAELVPPFGEDGFFYAQEAFFSLNLETALEGIRRHFFSGYEIRSLLSGLHNRARLMIQMRALKDAGALPSYGFKAETLDGLRARWGQSFAGSSEKNTFNIFSQNPFYLNRMRSQVDRLSLKKLIDFQEAFVEAFEKAIARPQDAESIMRECAVRCLSS
jgi:DNA polymerase III subunit delta